jgi:ATP-dependent DNA helicase RecG
MIIIEGAERFGLTQLHQLRGRVGRSGHKSYCFLFAESLTPQAEQRLAALKSSNDGFKIAGQDLLLRGPGEFLGTAQSGAPLFRVGHLVRDERLLHEVRQAISGILKKDPLLQCPANAPLRAFLKPGAEKVNL